MPQQLVNILDVLANQAAWDAAVQANNLALKRALRTMAMSIFTQGSTASPSIARIQLQNGNGEDITDEQFNLRVRVVNNNGYAVATNATINASGGTLIQETLTANKDLVLKSNATGLVELSCACAVASTFNLLLGHAPLLPVYANHNNLLAIVHA